MPVKKLSATTRRDRRSRPQLDLALKRDESERQLRAWICMRD